MKINSRYHSAFNYVLEKMYEVRSLYTKQQHEDTGVSFRGQLKGMFQPLATTVANVPRVLGRYKNSGKRLEDTFQGFFGVANLLKAVGIVVVAALQLPVGLTRDILQYLWSGVRSVRERNSEELSAPYFEMILGGKDNFFHLKIGGKGIFNILLNTVKRLINLLAFIVTRFAERTFHSLTWILTAAFTAVRGALQIALWPVAIALMPIRELRTWLNVPDILENKSVQNDIKAKNVDSLAERFSKNLEKGQFTSLDSTAVKAAYAEQDDAKFLAFFENHKTAKRATLSAKVAVGEFVDMASGHNVSDSYVKF